MVVWSSSHGPKLFQKLFNIGFENLRKPVKGVQVKAVFSTFDSLVMTITKSMSNHFFLGYPLSYANALNVVRDLLD